MSTTGALDDYLEELLGDALPPAPAAVVIAAPDRAAAADEPQDDGVAQAISAEFATGALAAALDAEAALTETDAPAALTDAALADAPAAFDTPTSPGSPGMLDLLDELMNDPALGPAVAASPVAPVVEGAAFDTPTSPGSPGMLDLLDELMNDPALGPAVAAPVTPGSAEPSSAAAAADRPSWDDLPDEVLHDTAAPASPAPVAKAAPVAPVAPPAPPARPAPAAPSTPAARATPMPSAAPLARPAPAPAPTPPAGHTRPSSWQELQAQARNPTSTFRENRRASERTSRWLRLRCGPQAYALELLKVQEVVLPVPLLPLRGTATAMLGIMNLRGQVVPVMDLGVHLGAGPVQEDTNTRIVVLEEDGETLGLRVSAVEDVANLTDSQIEPPDTARICQISNDLFRGVARISAQPMILLDASYLLN